VQRAFGMDVDVDVDVEGSAFSREGSSHSVLAAVAWAVASLSRLEARASWAWRRCVFILRRCRRRDVSGGGRGVSGV